MVRFDIITIFPEIFRSYLAESLIARAQKKKLIKINVHNLRKWTNDRHKTVDDRPYGGGLGMVMMVEPIFKAIKQIKGSPTVRTIGLKKKSKVILFTPRGRKFTQKLANKLSKLDQKIADMEVSIGDYDLMGGELPAMVAIETISRLVPGVLGKPVLLKERVSKTGGFLEYAQYTRPEVFFPTPGVGKKWRVPKVLLNGNHKKIDAWKREHGKVIAGDD